ncbi:universal stress protein [Streptomyces fungicidicus]|uniref:universal stress protein n=1 Tax=Streptomyces fungicidicus TaxID=68203 RepID=UPI0037FBDA80
MASEDVLTLAARRARRHHADLTVTTETVAEEPEYVLVREARNASVVIVGTRGRGGITDLLLGSVSLTVATEAACPVVVVRGAQDDRAADARHGRIVVGLRRRSAPPPQVRGSASARSA